MNARELLVLLRTEIADLAEPYLLNDPVLYSYIDDAQKQFCRLTEGIEDGRKFKVLVAAGKEWYAISPKILKLRKVVNAATGRELKVINLERMSSEGMFFDGRTGPIQALVTGVEKNFARAWPVPAAEATIHLNVFRLPDQIVRGTDDLEIDEHHHMHLLLWAKHLVYGVQDSELYDKNSSVDYGARFRDYCANARVEQERARRFVGSVIYGGI
jgi:hypothetical protein